MVEKTQAEWKKYRAGANKYSKHVIGGMEIPSDVYIALKGMKIRELPQKDIQIAGKALERIGVDGEIGADFSVAFLADLAAYEESKGKKADKRALAAIGKIITAAALAHPGY